MLNWIGSTGVDTTVKVWLTNQGKGGLELFDQAADQLLASGPDVLTYTISAPASAMSLSIVTAADSPADVDIRLMMEVTQAGVTLPAYQDITPANGTTHGPVAFDGAVPKDGAIGRFNSFLVFR